MKKYFGYVVFFIFGMLSIFILKIYNVNAQVSIGIQIENLNPTLPNASTTPPGDFFKITDNSDPLNPHICYLKPITGLFCL